MKKYRKWLSRITISVVALSIYPLFVLGYTWFHVVRSDFEGGRHGPLDAYRHTLASAVVSYTLGERAVALVTCVFESQDKDSNHMDGHNNRIGAAIGSTSPSFAELESTVRQRVLAGSQSSCNPDQVTWLRMERWGDARLW